MKQTSTTPRTETIRATKKPRDRYHHGDLKASLIAETERMVAANQLDQVTLNELGNRLGVARSAPYRHFTNKNDLLCVVATRYFERMRNLWHEYRTDTSRDPAETLLLMGRSYFELAVHKRDTYRLMYREGLVGDNESAELYAMRQQVFDELTALLEQAQAQGLIDSGDLVTQALFCWAPLHGMCSFVIDQHLDAELFSSMLEWTMESVLRGLGWQPSPGGD